MAKADIDFEKELWDAANELRGAVSENNNKNYILPLVFIKHLSERYEVVREELKEQLNDPSSDYYTTKKEEFSYVLEDRGEYRSRNTFKIPETASWQYLKDNAEQDDIKVKVDDVSNWHPEDLPDGDPRLFGTKEEFTTDGSASYMWMQTFWHHLSTTGTAGIVMTNRVMSSNNKGEKNVREHMVDNSMIDAIVRRKSPPAFLSSARNMTEKTALTVSATTRSCSWMPPKWAQWPAEN